MEEDLRNLFNAFPRLQLPDFEESVEEEAEEDIYLDRDVYLRLNEFNARQYAQLDHIFYNPRQHRPISMDPGV